MERMSSNAKKFWMSPELLERFLSFLDVSSLLQLGQAHQFTLQVLQVQSCWDKLTKRTLQLLSLDTEENEAAVVAQAELLKLMGTPEDLLHHLLDAVAKIFPPDGDFLEPGPFPRFPCLVRVSCPCLESHAVSPTGFLLLEEIECVLGTTEQKVEEVTIENLEGPLLAALSSRLSRQEGLATSIHSISAAASLDDSSCLITNCERVKIRSLTIVGEGTTEGWAGLGNGFSKKKLQVGRLYSLKSQMACARYDLKAIFDELPMGWIVIGKDEAGRRTVSDDFSGNWIGFKQSLSLPDPASFPPRGEEEKENKEEGKE